MTATDDPGFDPHTEVFDKYLYHGPPARQPQSEAGRPLRRKGNHPSRHSDLPRELRGGAIGSARCWLGGNSPANISADAFSCTFPANYPTVTFTR